MQENFVNIIKICIEKIKDELLLFSVFVIIVSTSFPEFKIVIFILYLVAVISYTIINGIKVYQTKDNNKFLENFKNYLKNNGVWEKRMIENTEVYFYKNDNNYKIKQADERNQDWTARESWMVNFPDSSIFEYKVFLKYGESQIAEFSFLYCDGCRYFIPIPKKKCIKQGDDWHCLEFEYYWEKESIEYNTGEIIGRFYHYTNLEEVAKFCGIKII